MYVQSDRYQEVDRIDPFARNRFKKPYVLLIIYHIIVILKLPILIILYPPFICIQILLSLLHATRATQFLQILIKKGLFKVYRFFTGTTSVDIQPTPLVDQYRDITEHIYPRQGDLIISNLGSILNTIFLDCNYSPIYCVPIDAENVLVKSIFPMLLDQLLVRNFCRYGKKMKFTDALKLARERFHCPLVIFPECATSNGLSVLRFKKFGIGQEIHDCRVHIIGFKHESIGEYLNLTLIGPYLQIIYLFGRPFGTLKVRTALPQDIPRFRDGIIDEEWIADCRNVLSVIMRVPLNTRCEEQYLKRVKS
ncbi:hypothetical protein TVAG_387980 [Trichomonas vaginalis G3]|uniref:Phospholipid/glycerol acyltransferase domain-containing protein n=1 Tax=Trichomonas vaginalis (strain ATCC PRA-98 / G3) TaxID=412133 RepID=A2E125_TRIV3|nr:phospholipid acyltransferase family [Trichomonas vaginalis G3]EAY13657.1 hypothetical protein TVAG_387980 [Trichomonas vaginalis G3]KAI5529931.1 phospholipid acyltransferase family [Trichomonas vaginalis G3]|eukprot:XP_001325880.1 hypothetical protein [Trichomonas vaginalis G3]